GKRSESKGPMTNGSAADDRRSTTSDSADGSCMIVIATDAPVDSRNLRRMAQRAIMGLARTGASGSNGSGDYAIAFSTAPELRIRVQPAIDKDHSTSELSNDA